MATDAEKGLHLLKVAAGDHACEPDGDHRWGRCPTCLAYQELDHKDGRRFLQAFLASLETPKTCTWTLDDHDDQCVYETQCGQTFEFMVDGPNENGFRFCGYCGGSLVVVRTSDERCAAGCDD